MQVICGFTGTQQGMTIWQRTALSRLLAELRPAEFHHGCCIGADEEAAWLAADQGCVIAEHPPTDEKKLSRNLPTWSRKFSPQPYLIRNQSIVKCSSVMIATPKEQEEVLRSGTWSTIRYAIKRATKLYIITPRGQVLEKANEPK